jgi:N-acetylmuramoyl-L-alanine amidase
MNPLLRSLVPALALTLAGTLLAGTSAAVPAAPRAERAATSTTPLSGVTIALDPGHQLGNHRFPRQTGAPRQAGGFTKPCNTTGTSTDSGVAEATVNYYLSRRIQHRLEALGARVRLTRLYNSQRFWGPCVDVRGAFGKRVGAQLEVSMHADGAASSAHGFHVIAPTRRAPWTTDIASASLRLATRLRDAFSAYGVPRSSYIGDGTGLDVRSDLGTLNLSDVPIAMIEIGNMRNASDARRMTTAAGQDRYAAAVVRGIRAYLGR